MANRKDQQVLIVVPVYNSMKFLPQCMESVLNQTSDCTIWACDNESEDGSYEFLLNLEPKYKNLKVFQLPNIVPNGFREAIEFSFENTDEEFLTFIPSDDFIASNYIENCEKEIEKYSAKCIQSPMVTVNEAGERTSNSVLQHFYADIEEFKNKCLFHSPVNTPTVVYHRDLYPLLKTGCEAHDAANLGYMGAEDYDTWCSLADKGVFLQPITDHLGYYYRWHAGQCTWAMHKAPVDYDQIISSYWRKRWNK